jgi:uncharacterized membrane protein YdcZ (DUF606 family)
MKTTGIVLLVIGILLTIFTTFQFFTREKVAEIGNLEIMHDKKNTLNWSPFVGIAVMVIGGVVLWQAGKK